MSSRIHFNVEYFKIWDSSTEVKRLMNSYLMSGGLMKERYGVMVNDDDGNDDDCQW